MNNNACITFAIQGNQFLVYIQRVTENASGSPNDYLANTRHLSKCVSDCSIGSVSLEDALKILCFTWMCSRTTYEHSHRTPVPVSRDPSHSKHWLRCHPIVRLFPEIDASKLSEQIFSSTSGSFQWLKYTVLMYSHRPWALCCNGVTFKMHVETKTNSSGVCRCRMLIWRKYERKVGMIAVESMLISKLIIVGM
jgi:hypothetical protein